MEKGIKGFQTTLNSQVEALVDVKRGIQEVTNSPARMLDLIQAVDTKNADSMQMMREAVDDQLDAFARGYNEQLFEENARLLKEKKKSKWELFKRGRDKQKLREVTRIQQRMEKIQTRLGEALKEKEGVQEENVWIRREARFREDQRREQGASLGKIGAISGWKDEQSWGVQREDDLRCDT